MINQCHSETGKGSLLIDPALQLDPPFTAGPTLYRGTHLPRFPSSNGGPALRLCSAVALRPPCLERVRLSSSNRRIGVREEVDDSTDPFSFTTESLSAFHVPAFQRSRGIITKRLAPFPLERSGSAKLNPFPLLGLSLLVHFHIYLTTLTSYSFRG